MAEQLCWSRAMTDRGRLIELILQGELEAEKNCVYYSRQSRIKAGIVADFLLENGVIVIDEKTALSMFAGAYAIENDDFLMMGDYGKVNADKKLNVIPYRKAAERLRQIAEKALKEREDK